MTYSLLGQGQGAFLPLSPLLLWRCWSLSLSLLVDNAAGSHQVVTPEPGRALPGLAIPAALSRHCRHSGKWVSFLLDLIWDFCHACEAQPSCPSCFCNRNTEAKAWAVWEGRGTFAGVFCRVKVALPAFCYPGLMLTGITGTLPVLTFSPLL